MNRHRIFLLLLTFTAIYTTGCAYAASYNQQPSREDSVAADTSQSDYISDISPEDCYLCGEPERASLAPYRGQINLGIINVNTFEFSPVSINRYDDNGNLVEEPAGYSSMTVNHFGEDGFRTYVMVNSDRGYADGTVYLEDDIELDMKKAAAFLCTDCLNATMQYCWNDAPLSVGIIDFSTNEIRLLERNVTAFMHGDFYVSCDLQEPTENESSWEEDLLIFYCPERYDE